MMGCEAVLVLFVLVLSSPARNSSSGPREMAGRKEAQGGARMHFVLFAVIL